MHWDEKVPNETLHNCHLFGFIYLQRELLKRDMPEDHIAFITKCVVKGLEYLRERGIQHRDVKPSNMLVNREGCVKVRKCLIY